MKHGLGAYTHGLCRCEVCTEANTVSHRAWRERQTEVSEHGLGGYNNYNCRCQICKAAKAIANREYRKTRKV